jgi:hypothetical protein
VSVHRVSRAARSRPSSGIGSNKVELEIESLAITGEVVAQLPLRFDQNRMLTTFAQVGEANPPRIVVSPNDRNEPNVTGNQIETSDG